MKDKDPFILQTANDYDMPYDEVERIKRLYPNQFYQKLEEYIKSKAQQNQTP